MRPTKVTIQVQVKSHDAAHLFNMGDANYRFDYDPRIIRNPAIVSQENFSNQPPSSDLNYVAQNLNGSSVGTTLGTVSLNTIYGGGGLGAKQVGTSWMTVACIRFDVQDATQCMNLIWHTDTQFPVTGMNEVVLLGGGDYDLYIVAAGGVFDNFNACTPLVCNAMLAIDDINVTNKDALVTGNLLTNDNSSGGAMTATTTPIVAPTNGTISINPDGSYTYTPTTGFVGTETVQYKVCNAAGICDTASLVIQVLDLPSATDNNAPIAQNDNGVTTMGVPLTGNVLSNDFDPNNNTLTVNTTPVTSPTNGTLTLNANGTFTYTPINGFVGQDTFRYQVCDNGTPSLCATAMVVLNVTIDNNGTSNNAPVANDDAVMAYINTAKTGDLKGNDSDPNGNTLTYNTTPLSNPAHGTVTITAAGTFTYTPTTGYIGTDQFKYVVCDNGTPSLCDSATVYVEVFPIPNLPPVVSETPKTVVEDTPTTLCVAITDPNATDTHTATLCGMAHGTGTVSVNNTTHEVCVTYTPTADYNGLDTICVIVCDSGTPTLCDTAKIPVTVTPVNDKPVVTITTPTTIPEDSTITVCGTIADPDAGDTFTSTPCGALHGTVSTTVTGGQVCMTYTPTLNYNGTDTLCFIVCDNGTPSKCDTVKKAITILPVNDVPVVSETPKTATEDTPLTICQTITDPDAGDTHTATACGALHGTLSTPSVSGGQVCVTYTPNADYNGADTVCVIVCDQAGLCDTAKIPVTVTPVDDKPTVVIAPITTPEDSAKTVCATINDPDAGSTFTATPCGASNGTVSATVTGSQVCVTYTPNLNFNGTDTACVIICDNTGLCDTTKIPVTVTPVNDAPVVSETPKTATEDTPLTICQTITDPDAGDTHTATACGALHGTLSTPSVSGGQVCVTYTPNADYNGADTVCVIVCDQAGLCDTAKIPVTVTPVDDKPTVVIAPITTPEDSAKTVCATINDPDAGSTFTATPCGASNGTVSATVTGSQVCVTYTPNLNFNGTDTACVIICDNTGLCDTTKIPVTVTPVNDAPVVSETPKIATEDTPLTICQTITDPDAGDTHTATACGALHGTLSTPSVSGGQVCVTYTPNADYNGADTVCVIVCDQAGLCDTAKIPVTVTPVDDKPTVVIAPITTPEDSAKTVCATINDPDAGSTFTATPCGASNGTVSATVTGSQVCVTYTPTTNYFGLDTACVIICDNTGLCDTVKVPVTITSVNDAPIVTDITTNAPNNVTTTTCVPVTDVDVVDNHTVTVCGNPIHGSIIPTINNVTHELCVAYTPTAGFVGADNACLLVCDNGNPSKCDTVQVIYNVTATNRAPVALNDMNNTISGIAVSGSVLGNDSDPDFNTLTVNTTPVDAPNNGSIILNANGTYTYSPNAGYVGTDTIVYRVCDNGIPSMCATANLIIEVRPSNVDGNQKPIANDDNTTTAANTPVTVNVKANDFDPQGGTLGNPSLIGTPAGGTPVLNANGTVTFTPAPGFIGMASFQYQICDNGTPSLCDTATVTVNVIPDVNLPNLAPIAVNDAASTPKNTAITANCATNDSDPNAGQVLTFTRQTNPSNGSVVFLPNGLYTYTPNPNFVGADSFRYQVCDNITPAMCATAMVYISVNETIVTPTNIAPVATDDNPVTVVNTPITIDVKANDFDVNGHPPQ